DVVGADRQLAVAAIDQHGQSDSSGTAEVVERVQGGPDGAPGEEDVVDQDDDLAVYARGRDHCLLRSSGRVRAQVVAIHRHVERADGDRGALDSGDPIADAPGKWYATSVQSEQDQVLGTLVPLEQLVRDASQRPGDVTGIQDGVS